VLARLLALACAPVELAEAEVAVGAERAHAQFFGEDHGLPVAGFSLFGIRRVAMRSDLAGEAAEGPALRRRAVDARESNSRT
jgi:hypothetical protein